MGTGEQSTPCGTCSGDGRVRKTKKIRCAPGLHALVTLEVCYTGSLDQSTGTSSWHRDSCRVSSPQAPQIRWPSLQASNAFCCCSLRVPAGVDTDSRLRVRGEGNAGRKSGPTGDLFVFINVRSDPGARPAVTAAQSKSQPRSSKHA